MDVLLSLAGMAVLGDLLVSRNEVEILGDV
jgi:hypothetical protein